MATSVKVTQIGNSLGVVLPKEALAKLRVGKGDTIHFVDAPNGFLMTPYDQEFAAQMEAARHVMRKHRDVLRRLAE